MLQESLLILIENNSNIFLKLISIRFFYVWVTYSIFHLNKNVPNFVYNQEYEQ